MNIVTINNMPFAVSRICPGNGYLGSGLKLPPEIVSYLRPDLASLYNVCKG